MEKGVSEWLLRQIVASTLAECGGCKRAYEPSNVTVLGHQEDLWFLSLICEHCQARCIVAALVRESDELGTPILCPEGCDLDPQNVEVAADDVLAMHQFLDDFDGDFKALFRR